MNCRDYQNLINRATDGRLSEDERQRLFEHCQKCPSCQEEMLLSQKLDLLLCEHLQPVEPPPDFLMRVMEALPSEPLAKRTVFRIPLWRNLGVAAASLVMVASVAAYGLLSGGGPALVAEDPGNPSTVVVANNEPNPDNATTSDPDPVTDDNTPATDPDATALPDPISATDDNAAAATEQTDPVTTVDNNSDDAAVDSGEVKLPTVASNTKIWGDFSLTLLAAAEGADVLLPTIEADGQIYYLIEKDGTYQLWQKDLAKDSGPQLVEESYSGSITDRESYVKSQDASVAVSPDGTMVAANTKGEDAELWVSNNDKDTQPTVNCKNAGGGLLSWAPNSGKLVFNDVNGYLYVIYPTEKVVLLVFEGRVDSVVWAEDSQTLVFAAKAANDADSKLYQVTLP